MRRFLFLALVILLLASMVHVVTGSPTIPISFHSSSKTGLLSGTSTSFTIYPNSGDTIILEEYSSSGPTITVTDSQLNSYILQTTVGISGPIFLTFFSAQASSATSDLVTINLSHSATYGVIVALYAGVSSIVTSSSSPWEGQGLTSSDPNYAIVPGSVLAGPAAQTVGDWFVGGTTINKLATCFGVIGLCFGSSCSINQGCPNQVQRQLDENSLSADFQDSNGTLPVLAHAGTCDSGIAGAGTGWCWIESYTHGPPLTGESYLAEVLDLVCCTSLPDQGPGNTAPPPQTPLVFGQPAVLVYSLVAGVLIFGFVIFVGIRRRK